MRRVLQADDLGWTYFNGNTCFDFGMLPDIVQRQIQPVGRTYWLNDGASKTGNSPGFEIDDMGRRISQYGMWRRLAESGNRQLVGHGAGHDEGAGFSPADGCNVLFESRRAAVLAKDIVVECCSTDSSELTDGGCGYRIR